MAIALDYQDCAPAVRTNRGRLLTRLHGLLPLWRSSDPAWDTVIAKKDDRLLQDIGLTRREALGTNGYFWHEWSRMREPWSL